MDEKKNLGDATFRAANKTGAVAIPSRRSAAAGLPS